METVLLRIDGAPHSSALGGVIFHKQACRSPSNFANQLHYATDHFSESHAPLCYNKLSCSSSPPLNSTCAGYGTVLTSSLHLGAADYYSSETDDAKVTSAGFIMDGRGSLRASLSSRSLPRASCKFMTFGSLDASPSWCQSPDRTIFSNGRRERVRTFAAVSPAATAIGAIFTRFSPESASRRISCNVASFGLGIGSAEHGSHFFYVRWFQVRRARNPHGVRQLCRATGQNGKEQPVPEEESPEPASEGSLPPVPEKSSDLPAAPPVESEPTEVDWRAFRARLVVTEQITSSTDTGSVNDEENGSNVNNLSKRWAHPILAPEAGCVLIATDKIDGQPNFERSVILLLSPGSNNPFEGPYGLILNRPLSSRIKDMKAKDRTLVKFFGNCQVHHGGPLDRDMFLLLHTTPGMKGYREVIPGVYYGSASGLEEIMKGKRPQDFRFFFGYSGWGVEQLKKEIDAGLWCVAACSTDLITGHSAAGLWEEILLLMGGKYSELSKRPRRRHF